MDGTGPSDDFKKGGLAASPFALYQTDIYTICFRVFGLALVEGIVVVRGEVEPIFAYVAFWWRQSAPGFCRHVYPDGFFAPYSSKSIKRHCFNQIPPASGLYLISDRAPLEFYRFVNVVLQFMTG